MSETPPPATESDDGPITRDDLLTMAGLFQGGLVLLTVFLATVTHVNLWEKFRIDGSAVGQATSTCTFLLLLLAVFRWVPWKPLRDIWELLDDLLAESLQDCYWWELAILAALAGISEELCFRGLLPQWLNPVLGVFPTLLLVSLLFGLLHAMTLIYFVLAFALGIFFGCLTEYLCDGNLFPAIVGHAVYDWMAFHVLIRIRQQRHNNLS